MVWVDGMTGIDPGKVAGISDGTVLAGLMLGLLRPEGSGTSALH